MEWPRWSGKIAAVLILCMLAPGLSANILLQSHPSGTRILVSLPEQTQFRLLNFSPARKILLKLSLPVNSPSAPVFQRKQIPELSSLAAINVSPLQQGEYLMVLELLERQEFRVQQDGGFLVITLADTAFRDPLMAWYYRGLYYQRRHDLGSALQYYRKIVFRDRRHRYAYFKAGQIRMAWKQFRLAEINFRKALQNGCDSTGLYLSLAKLYEATGRPQLATQYREKYQQLLNNQPASSGVQKEKAEEPPLKIRLAGESALSPQKAVADSNTTLSETHEDPIQVATSPGEKSHLRLSSPALLISSIVAGLLILSIGVLFWLKRLAKAEDRGQALPEDFDMDTWLAQKSKLLRLAEEAQHNPQPSLQAAPEETIQEEDALDGSLMDLFQQPEEEAASTTSPTYARVQKLARELQMPSGEIELALQLSVNRTPRNSLSRAQQRKILQLHEQQLSIPEIAKRLNLGQNEVELYLKFHRELSS